MLNFVTGSNGCLSTLNQSVTIFLDNFVYLGNTCNNSIISYPVKIIDGHQINTASSTPISSTIYWSLSRDVGGGSADLMIKDAFNNIVMGPVTSTATQQTGSLTILYTNTPFTVYVSASGVAGAEYRICNTTNTSEIYYNSVSDGNTDSYTVSPSPLNTFISVVYGGTPITCGV